MLFSSATLVLPEAALNGEVAAQAVSMLRHLVHPGGEALLLAHVREGHSNDRDWRSLSRRLERSERRLAEAARTLGALKVETDVVYAVEPGILRGEVLVLTGPEDDRLVSAALRSGLPVGWPGGREMVGLRGVVMPWWREPRSALPAAELLRERLPPEVHTWFLAIDPSGPRPDAEAIRGLLGWPTPLEVEVVTGGRTLLRAALRALTDRKPVDLVALAAPTGTALTPFLWMVRAVAPAAPFLVIPGARTPTELRPRLEVPDLLVLGDRLLGSALRVDITGRAEAVHGEHLTLMYRGTSIAQVEVSSGQFSLPTPERLPETVGVSTDAEATIRSLQGVARVIRPDGAPVALFDARLDPTLWRAHLGGSRRFWAVSLTPMASPGALREHLGLADALLEASGVLQDGHPDDLPAGVEPVRLERVARHLRAAGVPVDLVVGAEPGPGYASLPSEILAATPPDVLETWIARAWRAPHTHDRLLELTGAAPSGADSLIVEWDNRAARERLLALLADATESAHLQTYIFEDDRVGNLVSDALMAAADRGVVVRVLVDSLYSLHGSLGQENPPLARLEAHPGVSFHTMRLVNALEDVKRRNHRKLTIIDGFTGLVSGRNIGATYFTSFEETALTPETAYREVPWLDAGAVVTGPVVAELEGSFRQTWLNAGGRDYPAPRPHGEGALPVRFVTHESMADAQTLDAYRALMESARSRVTLVNTFPLQFELQQVLLTLLRRGVEVRFLVGNVRPAFVATAERLPFPGGQARELATQVIHGRLDVLVEAGASVYEFALAARPGWSPDIALALPHVHAKVLSVDGLRFTVGSANLDITAGYWESEALLVVEDPAATAALEATLDGLLSESMRVDPDDPAWRDRAERRAWLSRHWPSALG